ncbi:MAG TPA: arylamine N-acetyltransferase [Candidatus Didemnitutus sp.]|nr:arylamine N-acetyltransferase [Candidatus Didemnitutus sp.]
MPVDLDTYLARIGFGGPLRADLATLGALSSAHARAIPFENLDVLLGRGIRLEVSSLERKLVHDRRGGYCFEQNGLLLEVLRQIGFAATPLSARVRLQRARDFIPPRTHLFLRVDLDGASWLADVGIGSFSLTAPIRLLTDLEQPTPHETRRLVREGPLWFHQVRLAGVWQDVYDFTLEEMPPIDRELANWYTSTHPDSKFRQNLSVARADTDGRRRSLLNREFTRRDATGRGETTMLSSPAELRQCLAENFGLNFPADTEFQCAGLVW